jgi:hypothetical protein
LSLRDKGCLGGFCASNKLLADFHPAPCRCLWHLPASIGGEAGTASEGVLFFQIEQAGDDCRILAVMKLLFLAEKQLLNISRDEG